MSWINPECNRKMTIIVNNAQKGQTIRYESGDIWDVSDMALTELSDVRITSPVANHVLAYNGTRWINTNVNSTQSISNCSDVNLTGLQNNDVLVYDSSLLVW